MFKNQYSKQPLSKDIYIEKLQAQLLRVQALANDLTQAIRAITGLEKRVDALQESKGKHDQLFRLMQTYSDQKALEITNLKLSHQLKLQELEDLIYKNVSSRGIFKQKTEHVKENVKEVMKKEEQGQSKQIKKEEGLISRKEYQLDRKRMLKIVEGLMQKVQSLIGLNSKQKETKNSPKKK